MIREFPKEIVLGLTKPRVLKPIGGNAGDDNHSSVAVGHIGFYADRQRGSAAGRHK